MKKIKHFISNLVSGVLRLLLSEHGVLRLILELDDTSIFFFFLD